ncbi:hypothetical protein FRC03_008705 [Tulasnella sp. 419]|nr:hypothetical protein FRC03_008705 [Tulasnella sp. 419]
MVSPPETPSASMMRTSSAGSGGGLSGSGVRQGSGKWMSQKKNVGMKLEGVGVARVGLLGLGDGLPVVSPGRRASFGDLRKHEFHPNVGDVTLDTSKEGGEIKQSSR